MDTYTYTYAHTCTYTYIYIYIYRICKSCREREANVYADVHNMRLTYTPAHTWCATTPVNACQLCTKNVYGLVYARLFNCAAASLPRRLLRTYLESCANLTQAVVYCPPYRPPSCRQSVARRVRSRNPSKSTLAHDAVATAVLHKYHPIIRVGAGLIKFVYGCRSHLANRGYPSQKCVSAIFARVPREKERVCVCVRKRDSQRARERETLCVRAHTHSRERLSDKERDTRM